MTEPQTWKPSASLETLRLRARALACVRRFFETRGYWEVDTPLVSHERVVDPHLDPFLVSSEPTADGRALHPALPPLYLQTSPEFAMKRLLAAGAEAIYQLAHVFRCGELGQRHNPEFTMVEWYRTGDSHLEQMQVVEDLVLAVCGEVSAAEELFSADRTAPLKNPLAPFDRTTYREAFLKHAGADLMLMPTADLPEWVQTRGLHPPPGLERDDRDGWLNWLLAELVEPHLGRERPEFLIDYPASQAALARIRPGNPPVAERFELYWRGIELCNGYHELGDVAELERRIESESRRRVSEGLLPLAMPRQLLAAMRAGLPACSGVALGFDRLLAVALGTTSIHDVIPFSFEQS